MNERDICECGHRKGEHVKGNFSCLEQLDYGDCFCEKFTPQSRQNKIEDNHPHGSLLRRTERTGSADTVYCLEEGRHICEDCHKMKESKT
jgi:hypothetical protein